MSIEILLKNGKVIDGTGSSWFRADVAVADGRIQAVAPCVQGDAGEVLDVSRYFVCPGFIDAHTHSDYVFFIDPTAQSKVRQGVTTEVIGNCGMSGAPFFGGAREKLLPAPGGFVPFWASVPEYLEALQKQPKTVNLAPLIGHGTLRTAIVGHEDRPPTTDELTRMKDCLAEGLEAGAVGLSTGLYFVPGNFASQQELVELACIAGRHGTVVTSHIRDEGSRTVGFIPSVREIVHIGREARTPVQISHIKAFGPDTWHASGEVVRILDTARAEGIDVTCDQYPYDTTGGGLAADTLPYSFQSGKTPKQISEALRMPAVQGSIKEAVAMNIQKRGGPVPSPLPRTPLIPP
jgi:N-acyl-D-amino-acid deacylase